MKFQWCYNSVSRVFQERFQVLRKFQKCCYKISKKFQGNFQWGSRAFERSLKGMSVKFQWCYNAVSRVYQGSFQEVSRVFQKNFKKEGRFKGGVFHSSCK